MRLRTILRGQVLLALPYHRLCNGLRKREIYQLKLGNQSLIRERYAFKDA